MVIQFVDIAGRWEFPIPGMAGYRHFRDIILYPALPGTRTARLNAKNKKLMFGLLFSRWHL
jgi:hypothetical protein